MTRLARASAVCVVLASCACGQTNPLVAPSRETLLSVVVEKSAQPASQPQSIQMLATGSYSSGENVRDLTSVAAWQSSNPSLATVTTTGLVTLHPDVGDIGVGTITITASYQGKSGSIDPVFIPSPWDYSAFTPKRRRSISH